MPLLPILLLVLVIFAPRVMIVLYALFTPYLARAYDGLLLPLLGFVFLPVTTLAYAWAVNSAGGVEGTFWLVVMGLAVLLDLSSAAWHTRRYRS